MNQKLHIEILGGVLGDSFYTMIIRKAISEKQALGKKLPKSDATVKLRIKRFKFQRPHTTSLSEIHLGPQTRVIAGMGINTTVDIFLLEVMILACYINGIHWIRMAKKFSCFMIRMAFRQIQ